MSQEVVAKGALEIFDLLDADHDGILSRSELADALRIGGYVPNKTELDKTIAEIDRNGNGKISKLEFVNYVTNNEAKPPEPKASKLEEMFRNFDLDGDGAITLDELITISRIVTGGTRKDAETAFRMADTDGDGRITLDEFENLMNGSF